MPPRLRGYFAILTLVVAADWLAKLGVHTLSTPPVLNPDPLSWGYLSVVALGALIVWAYDRPLATIACGVGIGGGVANLLATKLFGPVADYIPDPFRDGWYLNIADLAIFSAAPVLAYLALSQLWFAARPPRHPESLPQST